LHDALCSALQHVQTLAEPRFWTLGRARKGRVFALARPGTLGGDPHRFATNDSAAFLLMVTRPARSGKAFGVQLRERGPSRFAP